jgi:hypothetical protein
VAFVEAVSGDNVTISEANWASPPNGLYNGTRTLTKRQMAIRSGYTLNGYIYVGGNPPPAKFQLGDRVLDGSPIATVPNSALATEAEIDFPALYTFTAIAQDDLDGTTWATQEVAVMSWPAALDHPGRVPNERRVQALHVGGGGPELPGVGQRRSEPNQLGGDRLHGSHQRHLAVLGHGRNEPCPAVLSGRAGAVIFHSSRRESALTFPLQRWSGLTSAAAKEDRGD